MGVEPTGDGVNPPSAGFEDRDDHRTACASVVGMQAYRVPQDLLHNPTSPYDTSGLSAWPELAN